MRGRLRAGRRKIERYLQRRAGLVSGGVSVLVAYGCVSHLTYSSCIMVAWLLHGARTGLSPLLPGQWAPFLAVYLAVCAVPFCLRPLRLAAALLLAPSIRRAIAAVDTAFGAPSPPPPPDGREGEGGGRGGGGGGKGGGRKRAVGASVALFNILLPLLYLHIGLRALTCAFGVPLLHTSAPLAHADVAKYALATVAGQVAAGPLGAIGALMLVDDFSWVRMASILIMG